ncbi:hypothetical protein Pcinc_005379 [Petrolisthes cinctipes]|uniref:Uncharacterized protein n=1 Tax=Petrolisthes cinctipes TaxID=88211 RepID=A0AAE1GDH5_PETCI|nr:hypothetical protein Pcinc_005379 [Petrolisthes cinctipes]
MTLPQTMIPQHTDNSLLQQSSTYNLSSYVQQPSSISGPMSERTGTVSTINNARHGTKTFLVVKQGQGVNQGITLEPWNNRVKFQNNSKTQWFSFDGIYFDNNTQDIFEAMAGPM